MHGFFQAQGTCLKGSLLQAPIQVALLARVPLIAPPSHLLMFPSQLSHKKSWL